ncbi:hypothetical protein ACJENM_24630, partial [Escherichia coli]
MTASTVFTTITLLTVIKWPFTFLPMALMQFAQFLVAVQRIEEFLKTPELLDRRTVTHVEAPVKRG